MADVNSTLPQKKGYNINLKAIFPTKTIVRFENEFSDIFAVGKGLRQACLLTPALFNTEKSWMNQETALQKLVHLSIILDMKMTPYCWLIVRGSPDID